MEEINGVRLVAGEDGGWGTRCGALGGDEEIRGMGRLLLLISSDFKYKQQDKLSHDFVTQCEGPHSLSTPAWFPVDNSNCSAVGTLVILGRGPVPFGTGVSTLVILGR